MSDARGAHGTLRNGRLRCVLAALHILNLVTVGECQSQSCPWFTYYQAGQGCTGTCPPGSIFVDRGPFCTFEAGDSKPDSGDSGEEMLPGGYTHLATGCVGHVLANDPGATGTTFGRNAAGTNFARHANGFPILDEDGQQTYKCLKETGPITHIGASTSWITCAFQVPSNPCPPCGAGKYESGDRSACVNCVRCVGAADARLLRQKPSGSLRAPR
jgi:hypothetical protein